MIVKNKVSQTQQKNEIFCPLQSMMAWKDGDSDASAVWK